MTGGQSGDAQGHTGAAGDGKPAAIVVLISGRGSNLRAILEQVKDGRLRADVRAVISNNPEAPGLAIAQAAGVATHVINHRGFDSRTAFEAALMKQIDAYRPVLVVLAGFMRVLGREFIEHYAGRLINIHPSLLPAFPGLDTHSRALAAGVREHGATVHFVTTEVDTGPVIARAVVPVLPDDNPSTLASRVLEAEHRLYPKAIGWFLANRLTIRDGKTVWLDGKISPEQGLG
jgi:phosphoribosylglycinamide formyltransferase-1